MRQWRFREEAVSGKGKASVTAIIPARNEAALAGAAVADSINFDNAAVGQAPAGWTATFIDRPQP